MRVVYVWIDSIVWFRYFRCNYKFFLRLEQNFLSDSSSSSSEGSSKSKSESGSESDKSNKSSTTTTVNTSQSPSKPGNLKQVMYIPLFYIC